MASVGIRSLDVGGQPEGYAFDEKHGLFFTNLEDKGGTVVIDIKTRAVTATWSVPVEGAKLKSPL